MFLILYVFKILIQTITLFKNHDNIINIIFNILNINTYYIINIIFINLNIIAHYIISTIFNNLNIIAHHILALFSLI